MKPRKELIIALGLLAFCGLNYFYLIPVQVEAEGSSSTYPILLNIMMAIFSVAYAIEAFRLMKKQAAEGLAEQETGPGFMALYGRTLLLIAATAIWLFVMGAAGFILSTFLFLLVASYIFGSRSKWKPIVLSLAMPFIFYSIFRGLNSQLPEGPIESILGNLLG